ncbi:hypothetical protein HQ945_04055 [Phyllobacterium sp. BT25]|uniref:Uncharacterized protein n=1 Tax=Phyllobacterium pellucidum TaxID=2740464 RepID=A0A849VNT7_9HYPH|nr:hypothetical protein [Phyllobacterium pellucidum]NTS30419.1 hypothetical protein [Phyllobacterium pellucidum]
MPEHEHRPVSVVGLILLCAATLIFLVVIWLVGSAFARSEPHFTQSEAAGGGVVIASLR